MQEWKTAPSSSATMASATCVVTHVLRSCRSHARVTSCTDLTPSDWPSPRWRRPCSGQRRGKWRSTSTVKMVGKKMILLDWFERCLDVGEDVHLFFGCWLVQVNTEMTLWCARMAQCLCMFGKESEVCALFYLKVRSDSDVVIEMSKWTIPKRRSVWVYFVLEKEMVVGECKEVGRVYAMLVAVWACMYRDGRYYIWVCLYV